MSDIEYLAIKENDGKLVKNEGFLSATGDLATLTASAGKDMYVARAKVAAFSNNDTSTAFIACEVVLKINNVIVETFKTSFGSGGTNVANGMVGTSYEFKNIGHKVAATQIIKLEVISIDAECDVEGFVECFEEPTGGDPRV